MKEVIGDMVVETDEHFVTVSVEDCTGDSEIVLCLSRKGSEGLRDLVNALTNAIKED